MLDISHAKDDKDYAVLQCSCIYNDDGVKEIMYGKTNYDNLLDIFICNQIFAGSS